jgi:hypothetical protein
MMGSQNDRFQCRSLHAAMPVEHRDIQRALIGRPEPQDAILEVRDARLAHETRAVIVIRLLLLCVATPSKHQITD